MCLEKLRRLQARTEVTTTTLWVATIRHNHTEDLSGEFRSCLSRRIQREGRRAGSRAVKMTASEKHCEQIDVIKRAVKLPRLCKYLKTAQHNYNNSASSSGASFFAWQRRARNEWLVMNRKGPWEGYRRQAKRRLARCLLPAFLCAHIFIKRETSGYEAVKNGYWQLSS